MLSAMDNPPRMFSVAERAAICQQALERHLEKHPEDKGKVEACCRQGSNADGSPHVWIQPVDSNA